LSLGLLVLFQPYGTFDQGGNVFEWNEAIGVGGNRGLRGGSFFYTGLSMHASIRSGHLWPSAEDIYSGFRVSEVPEPASIVMLALGSVLMLRRARGRG